MSDEPLVPSAEPADDGPVPAPEAEDSGRAPASAPSPLIIDPKEEHLQSLVFLHGLGDSAQGWELYMTDWAEVMPNMRFVLPSAAKRPVTKFAGDECTAWYDLEVLLRAGGGQRGVLRVPGARRGGRRARCYPLPPSFAWGNGCNIVGVVATLSMRGLEQMS